MDTPSNAKYGSVNAPILDVVSANLRTVFHLRNVKTRLFAQWSGGNDAPKLVVACKVTASGSTTKANTLATTPSTILLGMDCTMRWTNGTGACTPTSSGRPRSRSPRSSRATPCR